MDLLTAFGAAAVTVMLVSYALESRSTTWVFVFALGCAASSLYGALAGTWPFAVVEGVWAVVALRRWATQRRAKFAAQHSARLAGPSATGQPRLMLLDA